MGILDFFKKDKDEEEIIVSKKINVDKEIETLLLILENLNCLNPENIERQLRKEDKDYDRSILYRLRIDIREEEIEYFTRYFNSQKLGYGKEILKEIKEKLEARAKELNLAGRNKPEIVEELILEAKNEIKNYEKLVRKFNQIIETINSNEKTSETEKIVLIDYWTTYYKEQELGYEIDLARKVESLSEELQRLEFGGYGDGEIRKFQSRCIKKIKDLKQKGYSSKNILKAVEDQIYLKMKNEYLINVEVLKSKLKEIDESDLKDSEKESKKQKLIKSFNEEKGHEMDLNEKVEEMKKALLHLDEYGYGKDKIREFTKAAKRIIAQGEKVNLDTKEILRNLESEFNYYVRRYNEAYKKLQEMIENINNSSKSDEEKQKEIENLVENFEDEMGHPVDVDKRIERLIEELKQQGYGELKISEFEKRCQETKTNCEDKGASTTEIIKSIIITYNIYVRDIKDRKESLDRTIRTINENKSLTQREKKRAIDEFKICFDLEVGVPLDYDTKLEEFKNMLKNLQGGGYGEEAIEEFVSEVNKSKKELTTEASIYQTLRQTALVFKNRYLTNLSTFKEWKEDRISKYQGKDVEEYKNQLEEQIRYMLSLSPKALDEYYEEDNRKKKEEFESHNFKAAFRYLAKEEAKKKKDLSVFNQRIEELENGINPYSIEEIERAKRKLEERALFGNEEKNPEDTILNKVDMIDTTLYQQMFSVSTKRRGRVA